MIFERYLSLKELIAEWYLVWAQNIALRLQKQIPTSLCPPNLKRLNNLLTRCSRESAPTQTVEDQKPKVKTKNQNRTQHPPRQYKNKRQKSKPKTKMGLSTHPNRRSCAKAEPGYSGKLVVGHVGGNHELARQGGCHLAVGSLSGESIFNFILIFNRPPARSRLPSILWHLWPLTLWPPPPNPCPTPLSLPLLLPPVITNSLSNSQRWEFRASFFL